MIRLLPTPTHSAVKMLKPKLKLRPFGKKYGNNFFGESHLNQERRPTDIQGTPHPSPPTAHFLLEGRKPHKSLSDIQVMHHLCLCFVSGTWWILIALKLPNPQYLQGMPVKRHPKSLPYPILCVQKYSFNGYYSM